MPIAILVPSIFATPTRASYVDSRHLVKPNNTFHVRFRHLRRQPFGQYTGMKHRIRELREAAGLSMEALGERAGTSGSTINKLEKGQMQLDLDWMERLAAALGVDVVDLLAAPKRRTAAPSGFSDDAAPYRADAGNPVSGLEGPNRDLWEVTSNALDELGLDKGSIILVDISAAAVSGVRTGDPVVVQIYHSAPPGRATTVLRQYIEPNLLITNSKKENALPLNMTQTDAHIKGVIIHHIRTIRRP